VSRKDDISADLISSDEAIDMIVDAVLTGSKPLGKLTKDVLKAQERLRRVVDDDGWAAYLRLEEVLNERTSMQMELLVMWAVSVGARARR
jgi:hypothetical protein